jgi:putative DNA primase/helicase
MPEPEDLTTGTEPASTSKRTDASKSPSGAGDSPASAAINTLIFAEQRPHKGGTAKAGEPKRKTKSESTRRPARDNKPRGGGRATDATQETASRPIPDSVRNRFIRIGNDFYFPDGADAFTDHGDRITTRSENAVVIQSVVAIAQARDAREVTVAGTDLFKKEAWFAGKLAGLEVRGYEPTPLELERLVRAIERRTSAAREEVSPEGSSGLGRAGTGVDRQENRSGPDSPRERPLKEGDLVIGRLVDHGAARYHHKPNQQQSYYVRIETAQGESEFWGVDLERATRQSLSSPKIGDEVSLRAVGRQAVTVPAIKRDSEGREIGREELKTHRNQWSLERKGFIDRRAEMAEVFRNPGVGAAEAVKEYAELEGSYLKLQLARAFAEKNYTGENQEAFVARTRVVLAKDIEYGLPLEPVPLKARSDKSLEPEIVRDQDHLPTR